jgi:diacylglycerol kinase (ATP)
MRIAPGAVVDDGCLDVCLAAQVSKPTLLYNLTQIFSGKHLRCAAVSMHRAYSLTVDADPPQPLLIDGEVLGMTPATVRVLPGALPFLVPRP